MRKLFRNIHPLLSRVYYKVSSPPIPNLMGDREIEYSWIAANMPESSGRALDFGSGPGWLGLLAARKGFNVIAVDLKDVTWFWEHPRLEFTQGDIFHIGFLPEHFDLIINCSVVEHVGLPGRYGITDLMSDGDIEVMKLLRNILRPGKLMLLTIPVGRDRVFSYMHRVYGEERLPRLIQGLEVEKKEYWTKNDRNRWVCVEEKVALGTEPAEYCYGLGLFVLRKPIT